MGHAVRAELECRRRDLACVPSKYEVEDTPLKLQSGDAIADAVLFGIQKVSEPCGLALVVGGGRRLERRAPPAREAVSGDLGGPATTAMVLPEEVGAGAPAVVAVAVMAVTTAVVAAAAAAVVVAVAAAAAVAVAVAASLSPGSADGHGPYGIGNVGV